MKKKRIFLLVIVILIIIIAIAYFEQPSVKTVQVITTQYENRIKFDGIYFTQEYIVYAGELVRGNLKVDDGEKIPIGMNIYGNTYSKESGVIVNHLDGYENKFSLQDVNKLTYQDIDKTKVIEDKPGIKIINNSEWFIYAVINKNNVFKKHRTYNMVVGNSSYPAEVLSSANKGDKNYILFQIKNDLDILNLHRNINGYIIKSIYNGAVIPIKALFSLDGESKVLIKAKGYAELRNVKVLFSDDEVAVIAQADKGKKLQEYDEVICDPEGIKDGTKIR